VLAAALLGMIAAVILGTLAAIWGWQGRQQETLGAAEIANRLILSYLDDPTTMPSEALPVAYGPYRYHWDMERETVKLRDPEDLPPEVAAKRAERAGRSGLGRIEFVSVKVWLSEETGGRLSPDESTPQATLERLVDPLAFRNPDSIKKKFNNPDKLGAMLNDMVRDQQGGGDSGKNKDTSGGGGGR
jgi:hypothetical protein